MECSLKCAAVVLVAAVGCGLADVREASAEPAQQTTAPQSCDQVTRKSRVTDAFKLAPGQELKARSPSAEADTVELKNKIAVRVENLESLYDDACKNKKIVLFLDGRALKSLTPDLRASPAPDDTKMEFLTFELRRTNNSRAAWNAILGQPDFGRREVKVGVGFEDEFALGGSGKLKLTTIPIKWFLLWCAIFVLMMVIFFRLARDSTIIRDGAPTAVSAKGKGGTFSLSRSQGAFWFFIILAAYLFIGIVTGDFTDSINSTAVILLGIGAGTVMGSAVIDASKNTPEEVQAEREQAAALKSRLDDFQRKVGAKEAEIGASADAASSEKLQQERADLFAVRARNLSLYRKLTCESEHYLTDILSDANGISFHRFQMAAWTLVLGIIFVKEVYENLSMPTFNTLLMGLLGLSAGTYLGLKIPEATTGQPADAKN